MHILLEVFCIFAAIMAHIWAIRFVYPDFIWLVLGFIALSWFVRENLWKARASGMGSASAKKQNRFKHTLLRLGSNIGMCPLAPWRWHASWQKPTVIAILGNIAVMATLGAVYNTGLTFEEVMNLLPKKIALYLPWAFAQQLVVNGYFTNRLLLGLSTFPKFVQHRRELTCLLSGLIFGIAHIPNPVLVPVTCINGVISAYIFTKCRSVYPGAIAHAIIGSSVKTFLPGAWHHNLRIGPGFWM